LFPGEGMSSNDTDATASSSSSSHRRASDADLSGGAIAGIVIGTLLGLFVLVAALHALRKRCQRRRHAYERVAHELDAEERDFKKALEGRGGDDDTEFSDDEAAQLEMIEQYRNGLLNDEERGLTAAANAAAHSPKDGDKKD